MRYISGFGCGLVLILFTAVLSVQVANAVPAHLDLQRLGSNFNASDVPTTQRRGAAIAYNPDDNEYLVTWYDSRRPRENDIYARRLGSGGVFVGEDFPVVELVSSQSDPAAAYSTVDKKYLVSYRTQGFGGFNHGNAQFINPDGSTDGLPFNLSRGGHEPTLVYNPDDNDFLYTGRGAGFHSTVVSSERAAAEPSRRISDHTAVAPGGGVAYNPKANEYLATWRDVITPNLSAVRLGPDGSPIGETFVIADHHTGTQQASVVVYNPDADNYLVVYASIFGEGPLFGQFVLPDGTMTDEPFVINDEGGLRASVVYDAANHAFFMAWTRDGHVFGQVVLPDGTLFSDPIKLNDTRHAIDSDQPAIGYNSRDREVLVAWSDLRDLSDDRQHVFMQRVSLGPGTPEPGTVLLGTLGLAMVGACVSRRREEG